MSVDQVSEIARAVLYEGHILWPYRRSAVKNAQRWTFGGVYPPAYSEASGGTDRCTVEAACLLLGDDETVVDVRARFLQVVRRRVACTTASGARAYVDAAVVGGTRHLAWDEAVEREVALPALRVGDARAPVVAPVNVDAGVTEEAVGRMDDGSAASLVRDWQSLRGVLSASVESLNDGRFVVRVRLENGSAWAGEARDEAMRHTFASAHVVLHAQRGAFVSGFDPPPEHRAAVARCENRGLWPVLIGDEQARDTMLAAPIILYDHPRIAPESPGDLFDSGEIDQLLVLNVLSLSEEEQREMRDSDPRAREILERCLALTPEQLMQLHGVVRELRPMDDY